MAVRGPAAPRTVIPSAALARVRLAVARIDRMIGTMEAAALGVLVIIMTLVTLDQVVSRYVFDAPLIWSEEAARYLFIWVALIGAAAAVRRGSHYGLEVVFQRLPAGAQATFSIVIWLVMAAFAVVLTLKGVTETVQASRQFSSSLPMRMHWAYAAVPVGAGLMVWHLIARLIVHGPTRHPSHKETP
jgi:TRAP-type C4-dicarboxylate transport system permease small subunit